MNNFFQEENADEATAIMSILNLASVTTTAGQGERIYRGGFQRHICWLFPQGARQLLGCCYDDGGNVARPENLPADFDETNIHEWAGHFWMQAKEVVTKGAQAFYDSFESKIVEAPEDVREGHGGRMQVRPELVKSQEAFFSPLAADTAKKYASATATALVVLLQLFLNQALWSGVFFIAPFANSFVCPHGLYGIEDWPGSAGNCLFQDSLAWQDFVAKVLELVALPAANWTGDRLDELGKCIKGVFFCLVRSRPVISSQSYKASPLSVVVLACLFDAATGDLLKGSLANDLISALKRSLRGSMFLVFNDMLADVPGSPLRAMMVQLLNDHPHLGFQPDSPNLKLAASDQLKNQIQLYTEMFLFLRRENVFEIGHINRIQKVRLFDRLIWGWFTWLLFSFFFFLFC